MPFEYPKHPKTNHRNPLRDESGDNPFVDEGADEDAGENPYAASAEASGVSYRPEGYETTLVSRGRLVFWLGAIGLSGSAIGTTGTVLIFLASSAAAGTWVYFCAAMLPLGLAMSFSAWLLGSRDLRAIRAGAMEGSGSERTRRGRTMGMVGSLVAVAPVVYVFVQIVMMIAEEI